MTYVLGISCYYHDASATLLKDGVVVAAADEERFTRNKHEISFPSNAIKYCLQSQNITITQVDYIGFYEKPLLKFERILHQHLETFPRSYKTFLKSTPPLFNEKLRIIRKIRKIGYAGDVFFIQHHMSHAASAFLPSPFTKSAIVTVDGVGEWATTTYGIGNGNNITLLKQIQFPHSLGLLYSTITAYLGFKVNNDEYKVMGLSSYGNMTRTNQYYKKLKKTIDIKKDGSFRLDLNYFSYHYADRMPSKKLCDLLGGPVKRPETEITQRHKDISAALQMITEEVMTKILKHVHKVTKCDNIVLAGGVALNSAFNGKILRNTPFKKVWIQPNASDGGASMGVATYIYNTILKRKRNYRLTNVYLGPGYSTKEIKKFFDDNKISYSKFKNETELVKKTARLIYKNKIVGWFQGRMEWGPRALGTRSILANPCNPEMKEVMNKKVKHREPFRPFAPVICEEDVFEYFDCDKPLPAPTRFMLMVYPVKKHCRKKIPAVTHVDGTGRLQVIAKNENVRYYKLIKEFGKLSGVPVLLNTSFNVRGEPIVCTPQDAYNCFKGTGIDCLVIDNFLVKK